jgi:hypothetical protein
MSDTELSQFAEEAVSALEYEVSAALGRPVDLERPIKSTPPKRVNRLVHEPI